MSCDENERVPFQEVEALKAEVRAFVDEFDIGKVYFGTKSAGNPRLYNRLMDGGTVQRETLNKVRRFMARERKYLKPRAQEAAE